MLYLFLFLVVQPYTNDYSYFLQSPLIVILFNYLKNRNTYLCFSLMKLNLFVCRITQDVAMCFTLISIMNSLVVLKSNGLILHVADK